MSNTSNTCLINGDGGPIKVIVEADNGIRTVGDFWLWVKEDGDFKSVEADKHEAKTGDSGKDSFTLHTSPKQLDDAALTWVMNSCSFIPSVSTGKKRVLFYQDGDRCKTAKPVESTGKFPKCADGKQRRVTGEIYFKFVTTSEPLGLWKHMQDA